MADNVFEGGPCPVRNCGGKLVLTQDLCYCSACSNPPCSHCEHCELACDTCEWNEAEDPEDFAMPAPATARPPIAIDMAEEPTDNMVPYDESMKKLF